MRRQTTNKASSRACQVPQAGPRPTMSDVARIAGCSQATVSFVLNRKSGAHISPDMRHRVAEAARSLGYKIRSTAEAQPSGNAVRSGGNSRGQPRVSGSQTGKVVHEIGLGIVSGHFPVGSIIPGDAALMAHFGVSRTVLREAIKILSGKRLLHPKARVGTSVLDRREWNLFDPDLLMWHTEVGLDAAFIESIGEIRVALEPEAAALAARRRTNADLERLYRHVDQMGTPGISARAFVKADLEFHLAIAAAAENPFVRSISALIEVALVAMFTKSWPGNKRGGAARSAADHRAIADAIAIGDADRARAAMRVVIAEGIERGRGHELVDE